MTDDLLARIDAALDPLCPKCGEKTTDAALTLYGHCVVHGMALEYAPTTWLPNPLHEAATRIAEQIVDEHQRDADRRRNEAHGEALRRTARLVEEVARRPINPAFVEALGGCICDREPDTNASIPEEDCPAHASSSRAAEVEDWIVRHTGRRLFGWQRSLIERLYR